MHRPDPRSPARDPASEEHLSHAFRELHGPSLHGFALLLTLGDRRRAASLASAALGAADRHVTSLRHPERAAAWLRSRVVSAAGRRVAPMDASERMAALEPLGVSDQVMAGLAALGTLERAALIASWIERLDRRDVAVVVGRRGNRLEALLQRARRRYLNGHAAAPATGEPVAGPLAEAVRSVAARAMA